MGLFDKKKLEILRNKEIAHRHTIMIVDDEEAHLRSMESMLSEDYRIITAADGQQALDIINDMDQPESISLIISDQRMPGLSGIELFEKLLLIIPNTIRMILTAFTDVPVIIDSINKAKIYEFILKPFEPEDLILRVKRAIEAFDSQQELDDYRQNLEKKVNEEVSKNFIFFSTIAHDLRNVIGGLGFIDFLHENYHNITEDKKIDYIARTYDTKNRIVSFMEKFLEWAAKQFEYRPGKIEIRSLVQECFGLLEEKAKNKNITLLSEIPPDTVAFADRNMILSVLQTLMHNSLKFTNSSGWVKVGAASIDKNIEISVCDNGVGMKKEEIAEIFNRKKSTEGTAGEKGTGLGLKFCKDFIDKNKGTIEISSEPGQGTCVKFTLPIDGGENNAEC